MEYNMPFDVSLAEYEGLITRREYWDDLAEEWNWSTTEQKLVRLAGFVQQGGNLAKVIGNYADGRDEYKRLRIQHCVVFYILKLMVGNRMDMSQDIPLVNRIKRLNKDELTELLAEELKRDVRKSGKIGSDGNIHEDWELLSDSKWMNDEILDKIEYRHWRENPDEAFSTYSNRAQVWWDNRRSLW